MMRVDQPDPVPKRHASMGSLVIKPVEAKADLRQFIRVPWRIYATDPVWVPPLLIERREHLSPRNPYFAHARWRAWLALRGSTAVGRISAQIDQLYLDRYRNHSGFFGMLESDDDDEVFGRLLTTAEDWLRGEGMRRVLGPFNLSINDECGLLVDGFETPPVVMMGHAPAYYAPRLVASGYRPAQDLLAYRIASDFTLPHAMQALIRKTADNVRLRPLRRAQRRADFMILRDIFNDAWSENWGFVPFTEAEFLHIGANLSQLIDDDFVQIAEVDGEPAGMIVLLPNLNEAIHDLNGRLLPLGWLKLLWRLKRHYPSMARIPLMGVRKHYQTSLVGTAVAFLLIDALRGPARRHGIRQVELSWILEQNERMRGVIEGLGGECYKRYRIYAKQLAASGK